MKVGWPRSRIGDVALVKPSKGEARERLKAEDHVSFLPMQDIGIAVKYPQVKQQKRLSEVVGSYTYFAEGDVLLAKITPCFENGKLGIAKNLVNGIGFGSSEFLVFRPDTSICSEWLFYFLSGEDFRTEGAQRMGGAVGQQRVPREFVESYPIPVPPLSEQKRIVGILDEAFEGIATAKANAEKNLQNARDLFESHLNEVFTKRGEGWVEKRLGEIGTITSSKRIFQSEYVEVGVPFYRTKEVKELANGRKITTELFISKTRHKEIKAKFGVPKEGDILLTAIGTIGEIWVVEGQNDFYFKDGNVLWLKDFAFVNPYFLKYILIAFVENLNTMAHGAAYSALPIHRLNAHTVLLPPMPEQKQIIAQLDSLSAETRRLESIYQQKLAGLEELKKSLLHRAFAGEL